MDKFKKDVCGNFKPTMDYNGPYHKNFTSNCSSCIYFSYRNCQKGILPNIDTSHELF